MVATHLGNCPHHKQKDLTEVRSFVKLNDLLAGCRTILGRNRTGTSPTDHARGRAASPGQDDCLTLHIGRQSNVSTALRKGSNDTLRVGS